MQIIRQSLLVLLAIACWPVQAADLLTIGSIAPPLDIEHWVQDGKGKYKPVTKFDAGKVYVVEFWATWCGPCISSMPHLANLQKKYSEQGVQIVSISDEELETVDSFLDREIRGGGEGEKGDAAPATYRELTSAYCLTTDPDMSVYRDYMEAAAKGGIPTAFIVGKDSKIEWIGHPMEMDVPLAAVVENKWDRAAYIEQLKREEAAEKWLVIADVRARQEDFDGAVEMLDKVIELQPEDPNRKLQKLMLLIQIERFDAADSFLQDLYGKASNDSGLTDLFSWNIYEFAAKGYLPQRQLVPTAIKAINDILKVADQEEKSSLLDTLAHLLFVDGKLDQAIEFETKAASLAGEDSREFIENFLEELKQAKTQQAESTSKKVP